MDYRKPAVFGDNWSRSRYKVLPYFAAEQAFLIRPEVERVLDLGCANGWNMSRFAQYGRPALGLDTELPRVRLAQVHGPALVASGLQVPAADGSFDVVYIQHVLHHIGDVARALREARRLLRPGGILFLVETVEDNPIIRFGRRLHPSWLGDAVNASFRFADLQRALPENGFEPLLAEQYSVLFWLWEILPDQMPALEALTPLAVAVEQVAARLFRSYSAHCYLVARKEPGLL